MVIDTGNGASRFFNGLVLAGRVATELLAEEVQLDIAQSVLCGYHRTWLVSRNRAIVSALVHAVIFQDKVLILFLATSNEFNQAGKDTLQRLFTERFFLHEDTAALILQVQYLTDRFPFLILMEHAAFVAVLGIALNGEYDRQSTFGKLPEETLPGGVCSEICCIENAVVVVIAVLLYGLDPLQIASALVFADWVAVFIHIPPTHKLLDVLNLDIFNLQSLDISEEVFSQGTAIRVPRLTALCLGEIRTFQTGPQYHVSIRVFLPYLLKMGHQRTKFQCSDVLGEM